MICLYVSKVKQEAGQVIVISLVSQKGGGGNTMLALHLAVLAAEEGPSYLIDCDLRRGSASKWASRRGNDEGAPAWPLLIGDLGEGGLAQAVARLRNKPGFLFIDTWPAMMESVAEAARVSDLVLVPLRPNAEDLETVGDTLAMVRSTGVRCGVVINQARTFRQALEAYHALWRFPEWVCPHFLRDRRAFPAAYLASQAVSEMKGPAAQAATAEVRNVWHWTQKVLHEKSNKLPLSIDDHVSEIDQRDQSEAISHVPPPAVTTAPLQGGKPLTFFVTPADHKRLKRLVLSEEKTINEFVREAINEALRRRKLPGLAPQAANRGVPTGRAPSI